MVLDFYVVPENEFYLLFIYLFILSAVKDIFTILT